MKRKDPKSNHDDDDKNISKEEVTIISEDESFR